MTEELLNYFNGDELAASTWLNKYAKRDKHGNIVEQTPADMHKRMAKEFARIEKHYDDNVLPFDQEKFSNHYHKREPLTEKRIFELFDKFKYVIPAGSVMAGLGAEKPVSLSNCFVLPSPEDSYSSIMMTRLNQAELMKRRGGVGYDLSNLRPRGATVNNAAVTSTGAASFMDVCSDVTNEVAQQGRRGALMLAMNINHPDIEEFIEKKQDLTKVTGANVSVQVTDEFMKAVEGDKDYLLRWPVDAFNDPYNVMPQDYEEYNKLYLIKTNNHKGYVKKVKAKEIWNKIIHCTWNTAEPGVIFKDRMVNFSPDGCYQKYRGEATNPCVTGDTIVKTDKGDISIKELVDKVNNNEIINVLSYDINNDKIEYQQVTDGVLTRKNANIIEIETEDGNKIKLTPDHKVYTENRGYINAIELTSDDILLNSILLSTAEQKKIKQINIVSNEDVYDITVEKNHNFFANNILVHNCGEVFMSGLESCRLIAINMLSFIDKPFTKDANLNVNTVYDVTYDAMRLGDDLVDLENEAVRRILDVVKDDKYAVDVWTGILEKGENGRRCGLEFTAMSDMCAAMGYKFCTKEANEFIEKVCRLMMSAVLDCQTDMAIERGPFLDYDSNVENSNEWYKFISEEYPERYHMLNEVGRRNISFTTAGPTGTISMLTQTSSGIEPVFMPYYVRRRKCVTADDRVDYTDKLGINFTEFVVVHPQLKKWAEANMPELLSKFDELTEKEWEEIYKQSPWYGSCAQDINWQKRVEVQGIVQKYLITHSISSTVNLPNDVTEEEVSNIYMNAWRNGLKGITVYRDGSREGIMIKKEQKKEDDKFESYINAPKRPKVLPADFYSTKVKGEVFYVMVGLYKNKPYEIFVYRSENNKIIPQHKGTITKIKKSVYKFDSENIVIENISSKLTTEELATALYSSMLMRTGANLKYIIKTAQKVDDNITSFTAAMVRILRKYEKNEIIEGEKCPECGGKLIRENGCIHCIDCGWSRCE